MHHLKQEQNLLYVFIFVEKKICPTDMSDRITHVKTFNQIFFVSPKGM